MRKKILMGLGLCAIAAASMLAAAPARAGEWNFSYTGTSTTSVGGTGAITASGVLTASDTLNSHGGYDITSITGTRNGQAITGLGSGSACNPSYNCSGASNGYLVEYDNSLPIDLYGLFYTTAAGDFNLFNDATMTSPAYFEYPLGAGSYGGTPVNLTLMPVPEPSTLAVFGVGALATIFVAKRRRARPEA